MKYCSKCGKEIHAEAVVCPSCGCSVRGGNRDSSSFGFAFLGFLFPLIGLILYLIWQDEKPLRAKSAGKGALVGVCISVVIYLFYFIIIGALIAAL